MSLRHTCLMLIMARVRRIARSIPFVSVEAIKVDRIRAVFATSEVILQHWAESGHICCSVADRNFAVVLLYELSALMVQLLWVCHSPSRYAFMSRAAALTNGAATSVSGDVRTSLPTKNPPRLS